MRRLLALTLVVGSLAGCRNTSRPAQDPFFGRTTVPPPATGAVGARPCDPYYQPPAGAPLQPIPQTQPGTPNNLQGPGYGIAPGTSPAYGSPTPSGSPGYNNPGANPGSVPSATQPGGAYPPPPGYPGSPGYTPPAGSNPGAGTGSPGYGSSGGYGYQGSSAVSDSSGALVNTPAPAPADALGSAPSIMRIPASEETAGAAASDRLAETTPAPTPAPTPIVRTLQPRPRELAAGSSTAATTLAGPLTPTRASVPGELIEITDLPTTRNPSTADTARTPAEASVER